MRKWEYTIYRKLIKIKDEFAYRTILKGIVGIFYLRKANILFFLINFKNKKTN